MAPLPPDSTTRVYFDYDDGINQHTLVCRLGILGDPVVAMDAIDAFMESLAPSLSLITVVGARWSVSGSNVTNPLGWSGAATYGSGVMPAENAPRELRFIGRSADGRRNSVSVYGYDGPTPALYRINAEASVDISNAIVALESGVAGGNWYTISTQIPVWKPYASFNFNSYWERQARP